MRSVASHIKSEKERTSLLVRARDSVALLAIIAGGFWAATEFFWDRLVAPRFESALVQGETTHKIVGENDCCVFVEMSLSFKNVGKRPVFLVTSNLLVGARAMKLLAGAADFDQANENSRVLEQRSNVVQGALRRTEAQLFFGTSVPTASTFAVLLTGDVLRPRTVINPNESVGRQVALLIPKDLPFVSVRASLILAHAREVARDIVWTWYSDADDMESQVTPWPEAELKSKRNLKDCAQFGRSPTSFVRCRDELNTKVRAIWKELEEADPYYYAAPYVYDFAAARDSKPATQTSKK